MTETGNVKNERKIQFRRTEKSISLHKFATIVGKRKSPKTRKNVIIKLESSERNSKKFLPSKEE